jgi:hypothetical protein
MRIVWGHDQWDRGTQLEQNAQVVWRGAAWRGKGEGGLVENDVARDNDAVRGKVKTSVPLVLRGVAEEDTLRRAWSEFVGSDGREVGVASTPEDTKVRIGGSGTKEGKVRRRGGYCFGGEEVEEISGGVKTLNPVAGWKRSLE